MNTASRLPELDRTTALAALAGAAGLATAIGLAHRSSTTGSPNRVLITGGASGFGFELAKRYIARGDSVIVTDLHEEATPEVRALGDRASYRRLDVTSDEDWEAAAAAVGSVDVLILNAGMAVGGAVEKVPMETWNKTINLNLLGAVRGFRAFVPLMRSGGRIVVTASMAGLFHPIKMSTYNATKAALVALAETADFELRERGISVTAICPQFFRSNLVTSLTGDDDDADDLARVLMTRTPLTAQTVADRAMKGIDARRQVVTTDSVATIGWYAKRFARPLYLATMRASGKGTWILTKFSPRMPDAPARR